MTDQETRELLRELYDLVWRECPSVLNEDAGGEARLYLRIRAALCAVPQEPEPELLDSICPWCGDPLRVLKPSGGCSIAEKHGYAWHPQCCDALEAALSPRSPEAQEPPLIASADMKEPECPSGLSAAYRLRQIESQLADTKEEPPT